MKPSVLAIVLALSLSLAPLLLSGEEPDIDRGRALYETHCNQCHSESVHGRTKRVATDFNDIRGWVSRWRTNLALGWTDDDVEAVAIYLNNTYYHFGCPPDVCKVISRAP
jgi:hypothetical protein